LRRAGEGAPPVTLHCRIESVAGQAHAARHADHHHRRRVLAVADLLVAKRAESAATKPVLPSGVTTRREKRLVPPRSPEMPSPSPEK